MQPFVLGSLAVYALVVLAALALRSRSYAVFRGIGLGLHTALAVALWPLSGPFAIPFLYLHATVYLHSLALVRPALRPLVYRVLVSVPSAFFSAGTLLALPWALASAFGFRPWAPWLPYAVAFIGVVQSLSSRKDEKDLVVDGGTVSSLRRVVSSDARCARPLRIVQITDPHLGPFMSVERLRRICERAVARKPDLIFLTGDFLTMESQGDFRLLGHALEPLRALEGRVFACRGNHDHEAPVTVARALEHAGVTLLVDEVANVDTEAVPVQVIGADFTWSDRQRALREISEKYAREPGRLRILLLHDPGAFKHVPEGAADLVLSGHTHGGQVGLVSLGLPWTLLRVLMKAPDHGFWGMGSNRLYVHRGTGHYGFPLRLGVPAEESLLLVHPLAFAKASPGT